VGGFVAVNDEGKIAHCYSNGSVNGVKFMGGFVGKNYLGDIILCYWDKDTSGMTWSDGGTGKTTDELKQQATFVIWDFADIWCIGEDVTYPHLRYMPEQVTASTTGSGNVFFDVEEPYALADLEAVDESNLPTAGKPDLRFPHGFFSFKIIGLTPGASATVTITFPSDIKTEYWKYHEPEGWIDVTSLMGSNDGDNILTLTITDGDLGDDDNEVNSIIVDQGGPGFPVKRVRTSSVVGGVLIPMNDLIILLPYFALVGLIGIIATVLVTRKKRKE
jgi:hypothetical protein